jgi:uncharacterized membrane protein YeiB
VLAPVGQMALTNYLTQSIVCTLIFYGYGLGLFGQMGMAAGIGLTFVIYLLQIPISHWWMKRFKYGPAEWLWRSLTYLKPQPMSREKSQNETRTALAELSLADGSIAGLEHHPRPENYFG